jgi:CheY-like chemotaxis protein
MQQAGGRIDVRSEVGRGSVFTLYFPASREPVERRRVSDVEKPAPGSETIVVVEDEAAVRRLVVHVLRCNGYHVLPAATGAEALETCRSHDGKLSLVITDVVMPGMSGPELVERLAAIRPTRVIYMSGYAGDAVSHHGITEARVRFLPKPFTPRSLLAKVREALDEERVS